MKELQRRMSSPEFAEWMAYDRLEPIGPRQPNDAAAVIAAAVYNAARNPDGTAIVSSPVSPADFGLGEYASAEDLEARRQQELADKIERVMRGGG